MPSDIHAHHRPRFHISQASGYLNDPNGPIEVGRTTHLYFQSRPTVDTMDPVEWGHATSDDLVHWTMHRSAIVPTEGGLDVDGCWSGNTLLTDEGIRAFYSGHDRTRPLERLVTALSRDGGASFGPPELLVADPAPEEQVRMLRDPFVWADERGLLMVAGSIVGDRAAMRLYRSADGSPWRFERELASLPRSAVRGIDTGEGWECPQVIRLGEREVALVGSWSFAGGTSQVLAFPLDDVGALDVFDDGDSFYAPSVMRESSHGPVVLGWLRETREPGWWRDAGWAGAISVPRRAWLDGASARSEPVAGLAALRRGDAQRGEVAIGAQAEIALDHRSRTTRLAFGPDEWLDLEVDLTAGSLRIDRRSASRDDRADGSPIRIEGAFDVDAARPAARVLLDGSVLEVFTSSGRSAATRVYPLTPPPWHVSADDGAEVWALRGSIADRSAPAADREQEGRVVRA